MIINHKGKSLTTKLVMEDSLEPELIELVRNEYYLEDKGKALANIRRVLGGQVMTTDIYNYYFDRIANDTVLSTCKWSVNELLENDYLVQLFINKTKGNPKVFKGDLVPDFKTAIRLGGKGYAKRPTQFPMKTALASLKESQGKVYVDTSAGWDIRMLASAVLGLEYIGFDVNKKLLVKLQELGEDIQSIDPTFKFSLIGQGSEIFAPELEGKADIVFTSPPYFNLENYGNHNGSGHDLVDSSYEDWVDNFLQETISNIEMYLKPNALVGLNINNIKGYNLVEDLQDCFDNTDLVFEGYTDLNNIERAKSNGGFNDNTEKIFWYRKKQLPRWEGE